MFLSTSAILPSNQSPLGALPSRFRRERVLIVGCGDIGLRAARLMSAKVRLLALTSSPDRRLELRQQGLTPLAGNLDEPQSLRRLAGLATRVLHLAPPPSLGAGDPRSRHLLQALRRRLLPVSLVYGSTSGVYGDCAGEWVSETRTLAPATERARRRVQAEALLRYLGRASGVRVSLLRIPGIYAPNRPGGTPRERLLKGTPALRASEDVYSNHIHADDLARICVSALWRGKPQRSYNANDDSAMKMGDYFDLAADLYGLPRPARISRSLARQQLSPMLQSFMSESRRLDNTRMKTELRTRLRYPTPATGLRSPILAPPTL
jgi:nucleoside-diphosphate-sugar epimerase